MTDSSLAAALQDRYVIERELGRGGMATVYLARDLKHGRHVALKVLHPELAASLGPERFQREIETVARLQHPHILTVHDSGEAAGQLWFTMPFVEGESLRDRLRREQQLPVEVALRIATDAARALQYAHEHSVIHRDIKPENLLLTKDGSTLVADFGIAKALSGGDDRLTETGISVGTPAYMSPEQATGDRTLDARTDVYALGAVLYEMLAGEPPFTGPTAQAVIAKRFSGEVPRVRRVRPSVPESVELAVIRALAPVPADRFASAIEFARALEPTITTPTATPTAPLGSAVRAASVTSLLVRKPVRRRSVALALGAGLIAAAAGWLIFHRSRASAPLDPDLVAVAPFDVPDSKLSLWREGLVDVLSRNLDGAGPVRSVAPTTVIRRWSGRADRPSASALGRRTGAGLVVFGSLIGTGPDSARLTVTALDVLEDRPIADIELRDAANRMDRLADSVTVRLLRELGRTRRIEVFRTTSLGSTSLPALKAFLQGEQWFRRAAWDSAFASYERAIALDSMFPLALRRAGQVLGWQHSAFDSVSQALAIRAGALNHGLATRDSLLVTADSLFAAVYSTVPRVDGSLIRRVHAVAQELTRRYPDDFESWYVLGEARYHLGSPAGSSPREALEAFDHAIRNDSSFAPAYIHPVDLALWLDGPEAGDRYAKGYLRLDPTDVSASGIGLVDRLMEVRPRPQEIRRLLRDASPSALNDAWLALRRAADSAESDIGVARALAAAPEGDAPWLTRTQRQRALGVSLLYRGHVRDAVTILYQNPSSLPPQLIEAALLSLALPDSKALPDSALPMFRNWLSSRPTMGAATTLPLWLTLRDSASIGVLQRRSDSLARSAPSGVDRNLATYTSAAALAYLALLRHDTTTAVRRFESLPDSLCPFCYLQRLTLAQLLSARHEDRKAAKLLDRWLIELLVPSEVLWTLERARVAERLGDREKAGRNYQYVANVWRRADPELQPYVTEAREGLTRVVGEPH
jgi:serine/threonine protein kinase/tetratricopeptide (TPR) repeat protein